MKKLQVLGFLAAFATSFQATAGGRHFPSDIAELTISNASYVDTEEKIIRGALPNKGQLQELSRFKVTDVIILRSQQADAEIQALLNLGFKKDRIHLLPFEWQKPEPFTVACQKVVTALQEIATVQKSKNRKAFFHCTYGEDRTGMISGLYRQLSQKWSAEEAFTTEMCPNGYEAGNPGKPPRVVQGIRESLTPLYLKMSRLIQTRAITLDRFDMRVCDHDPGEQARIPVCDRPGQRRSSLRF